MDSCSSITQWGPTKHEIAFCGGDVQISSEHWDGEKRYLNLSLYDFLTIITPSCFHSKKYYVPGMFSSGGVCDLAYGVLPIQVNGMIPEIWIMVTDC